MERSFKSYFKIAIIICLAAFIYYVYAYHFPHARNDFKDTRYIIIKRGEGLRDVARHLEELGAISSKTDFVLFGALFGDSRKLKSGRYALKPSYSMARIMGIIVRGEAAPFNVSIPEGLTMAQIGHMLENEVGMDLDAFKTEVANRQILDSLQIEADNLEGYLAPSTYNFFYEENAAVVIDKMVGHFFEVLPDSFEIKANKLGLNFQEAVTLASMIEEEAMVDSERPIIAAVFLNRLRKRMRLECDPTVIYAIGGLNRPLLRKDLQFDSPYNTYRTYGLPPGPISNPGVISLEAAVNPSSVGYLYFVARGDGTHEFTGTLRDHVNATNKFRKMWRN